MTRIVSFIVLLGILLLVGVIFFQVMATFLVPLFLASVLVVIFQPLYVWFQYHLPGHQRLAALATTIVILLAVLLPAVILGLRAYTESNLVYETYFNNEEQVAALAASFEERTERLQELYTRFTRRPPPDTGEMLDAVAAGVGTFVLAGVQTAVAVLIGLVIMMVAVYYFLADGPKMIRTFMRLSPLDNIYERELLRRFGDVSRSVVLATLLSAVVQGAAAGVGYYFALPSNAPIFLLTAITMVVAIVPFVGAAGVWVPVGLWLLVYGPTQAADGQLVYEGNMVRALALALYCGVIVSSLDNIVKPYILHGQANLHPLLALLSILGGVQVLGPIGILVGPMLVSFFQALLNMLHKELESFENGGENSENTLAEQASNAVGALVENITSPNAPGADGQKTPKVSAAATKPAPQG